MRISIYILFYLFALTSCQKFTWNNPYDIATPKSVFTPDGLAVRQEGENLLLSWSQDNSNISGFKLFRSIDRGVSTELVTLNKTTLSYTDANIQGGKTYTYSLKAYADKNESNEVSTEIVAKSRPTINTIAASAITENTATSGGAIVSDGGSPITSKGLVWSTSVNPTIDLTTKTNDGNGSSAFERILTNLSPNTIYYVRAYATNSVGTAYGNQLTFTTGKPSAPPILESLTQGLVAYYPFNGNANDSSGNNFNGIVNGATLTVDRFNKLNSSYNFQSTGQFIDLSSYNFNILGNAPRTVTCWIYPTNNSYSYMNIFASGNGVSGITSSNNGKTFNLRLNTVPTPQSYNLGFMGYGNAGNDFDPLNGTPIFNNQWTHVAVTFASGTITLYVNGNKGGSGVVSLNTSGNSNFIGRSNHTTAYNYFNGKIDDVRVYNRALTQEEITYLANN